MNRRLPRYIGLLSIFVFFAGPIWGETEQAVPLRAEIERLEYEVGQLELEKEKLVSESDELAEKVEKLKKEAESGTGIIGEYKLKKELRRSQVLSKRIETLKSEVEAAKTAIVERKRALKELYEKEIAVLLERLDRSSKKVTEVLLRRLNELRAAIENLRLADEVVPIENIRIEQLSIEREDSPEKLREKADLVSDFVDKLQDRICLIDEKMERLVREKKTDDKVRELVRELSLFDEDLLTTRGLQVESGEKTLGETDFTESSSRDFAPEETRISAERTPDVSIIGWNVSTEEIEEEIEALKRERNVLAEKSAEFSKKAEIFYRKAAELSKSKGATIEP